MLSATRYLLATARLGLGVAAFIVAQLSLAAEPADAQAADPGVTDQQVRAAIDRSLPYLIQGGESWIADKDCVSCHRVSFMTWSLNRASAKGFSIQDDQLRDWLEWSVAKSLATSGPDEPVDGTSNVDGLAQLILGHRAESPVALADEPREEFVGVILDTQQEDGSWKPAGQLPGQKRPAAETTAVSTMWNTLALLTAAAEDAKVRQAGQRSLDYLQSAKDGVSTEWHAARLLLSHAQHGEQSPEVRAALERLIDLQHADGGWGWLTQEASDGLATGQALFALLVAGLPVDDSTVQQARAFLIRSQADDGSWQVHGTKVKKKDRVEETATYWGTAWATLGLLETLPTP